MSSHRKVKNKRAEQKRQIYDNMFDKPKVIVEPRPLSTEPQAEKKAKNAGKTKRAERENKRKTS